MRPRPVLLLTGTCGSGKSTIARALAKRPDWSRIAEDDIWPPLFGRDRGAFGTAEHRAKRAEVHSRVFAQVLAARARSRQVVIEATVHEAPPEALHEYAAWFDEQQIPWLVRVLHPALEVAIRRDAQRSSGALGATRVASLHAKFTRELLGAERFLDTSLDTPEETLERVLRSLEIPEREGAGPLSG